MWLTGSYFPDQGLNPSPQQLKKKCSVLTTRLPGNSITFHETKRMKSSCGSLFFTKSWQLDWVVLGHREHKAQSRFSYYLCNYCKKGDPFQGPKLGSCLTLRNELFEETHVLTKQEILFGKGTRVESSRVREPRRTALPCCSLRFYGDGISFRVVFGQSF